mmetsp:Transcript_48124/g.76075  ORF Transcript_48124/g.76075 Transcript_48124/m.76075 type:complete len:113 (+) Transcript_48124:842-1180(+)
MHAVVSQLSLCPPQHSWIEEGGDCIRGASARTFEEFGTLRTFSGEFLQARPSPPYCDGNNFHGVRLMAEARHCYIDTPLHTMLDVALWQVVHSSLQVPYAGRQTKLKLWSRF